MSYLQNDIDVHLAKSPTDGIPGITEASKIRNNDLKNKYASALANRKSVQAKGIESFADLVAKYSYLFKK